MSSPDRASVACGLRLVVIVPAYNEAGVIERRLRNLLAGTWPAGRHLLLVVNDQSTDDTAERARAVFETYALPDGVAAEVVTSQGRPGKPSALKAGLARARALGSYDLAVVTDADVVTDPGALVTISQAFQRDSALAIACGSQRFVESLCESGQVQAPGGRSLVAAGGSYDGLTGQVRRLESRYGRLMSLHGQLMAWRLDIGLMPRTGFAADDLDLVLQLGQQSSGAQRRVRMISDALFYEVKTEPGPAAEQQALRRARAYVQVLRASRAPRRDLLAKLQWSLYRFLPIWAPELAALGAATLLVALAMMNPWAGALSCLGLLFILLTPLGRRWLQLMRVIRRARRLESEAAQPERWEMAR